MTATQPLWRFMFASPWHFLALGLGSGLPRHAPGTFATMFAWLLFLRIDRVFGELAWWGLVALTFVAGAAAAQITGARLGAADSGHIVIDEIVGFWIVLLMLPGDAAQGSLLLLAAFALFRLFDIAKPPPIRWLDARFKNGFGVMIDDLVAALYTLLAIAIGVRVLS